VELRQGLWEFVRGLNRDGHTIVLTTHYLEEAEDLCARIAMLKAGARRPRSITTSNLINRTGQPVFAAAPRRSGAAAALAARVRDCRDAVHTLRLRSYAEIERCARQVRERARRSRSWSCCSRIWKTCSYRSCKRLEAKMIPRRFSRLQALTFMSGFWHAAVQGTAALLESGVSDHPADNRC